MSQDLKIVIEYGKEEKEHFHHEVELVYVLDGTMNLFLSEGSYTLPKNSIIVINTGKVHGWKCKGESLLCRIFINYSFLAKSMNRTFISFWCNSILHQGDEEYGKLRIILNSILREYGNCNEEESFLVKSMKFMLLECLTKDFVFQCDNHWSAIVDERMEQAVQYINCNYFRVVSLKEIASKLYMSESSFSRVFKKSTGINFVEYVNGIRLHYAVEELVYSNKPITVISEECGFSNPSAFNKLFRKAYECSPTQYRNLNKKQTISVNEEKNTVMERVKQLLKTSEHKTNKENSKRIEIQVEPEILYEYKRENNICINMGMAEDLLQTRICEHILDMKKELGFKYVRICNIFDHTMYVQIKSKSKSKDINFSHIDNVLDFIIESGMYPIIDLENRSKRAYLDIGKVLFEDMNSQLCYYEDLEDWKTLLQLFLKRILQRYGEECVSKWYFEIGYNSSSTLKKSTIPYEHMWRESYKVFREIEPALKIGGNGYGLNTSPEELENHIEYWIKNNCRPDFLTMYCYPYREYFKGKEVYMGRVTDMNYVRTKLQLYKQMVKPLNYQDKDIVVTEWNTSVSERNYYNDTCAKAAHIVRNMIQSIGGETIFCYYHGSDFLCQYYDTNVPLVGGTGLVTKDGIPKPVYFAFKFMNKLYKNVLAKGENYIITTNGKGNYYILLCNARSFNHNYFLKAENQIEVSDLEKIFDEEEVTLNIVLKDVQNEAYWIKKQVLNQEYGSILQEWKYMGYIGEFEKTEIEYLKSVCRPHLQYEKQKAVGNNLILNLKLAAHEIMLLHIYI